jgi:hypothetical protein
MKYLRQKVRGVLAVLLLLSLGRGYGQEVAVPPSIQVPGGSRLLLHLYAQGVQVYVYSPLPADTARFGWVLVEAKAGLYTDADYRQEAGKHYFNSAHHPVWAAVDGSTVEGAKIQQADAPVPGAVPWLLLKAAAVTGKGPLASTAFVQRVNTKGGKLTAGNAEAGDKGQTIEVDYTAEYLFYGNN